MGLLSSAYGAVDRFLPADGLLDPMFAPRGQTGGIDPGLLASAPAVSSQPRAGARFNPLRAVDSFLGLGVADAIDGERSRVRSLDLKLTASQIMNDPSLDKAARLQRMRAAVSEAGATGADVSGWTKALDAAESQMNLMGLFQPKATADVVAGAVPAGGVPNLPDVGPVIAREFFRNPDAATKVQSLLKDSQPEFDYERGVRFNKKGGAGPAYIPDLEKGEEPLFSANGEVVGVRNMAGVVQSIEERERAKSRAQEEEKARLDVIPLNMPDGSTVQVPRLAAVGALGGVPGSAPGLPQGLGRSQSPAAKERDVGLAKTDVERHAEQPKVYAGLESQSRTTDIVLEKIDEALGQISGFTAGLMEGTANIPGTPARDLKGTLDTIRANVGFDKLQDMRNNSPTGGALGNVSQQENVLLQSVLGALDQGQSPAQLKSNLQRLQRELSAVREERRRLYQQTYGGSSGSAPAAPARGQRQPGQVYQTPRGPMKWTGTGWLPQ